MLLSSFLAAYVAFTSVTSGLVIRQSSQYIQHATTATNTLQKLFYDKNDGLYVGLNAAGHTTSTFWWNSANCLTALADLTAVDNSIRDVTLPVLENSYSRAGKNGFIDNYNDDDLWWALAWIATYDITKDHKYLNTAVSIFQHVAFTQSNSTCGGVWWNTKHHTQNAITNELFLSVAAHLANRVANGAYYHDWAHRQWNFFEHSGLIRPSGLIVDGLDGTTCDAIASDPSFSYNQGVILGALVELNTASGNRTLIDIAEKIASASIKALSDSKGILTEFGSKGSPDIGKNGATFKGVYIRNLQILAQKTNDKTYIDFITRQADSIWANDRSAHNGTLGNVWDKYYGQLAAPGHCSALEALIAAAAVSS